jgi:hypothetical protein
VKWTLLVHYFCFLNPLYFDVLYLREFFPGVFCVCTLVVLMWVFGQSTIKNPLTSCITFDNSQYLQVCMLGVSGRH